MSGQASSSVGVKQFLTEEQIEVERQRRQADWERVRTAQDPLGTHILLRCPCLWSFSLAEAPQEPYDSRSLYDKLKSQNDAKKKEFEDMWAASKYPSRELSSPCKSRPS